MAIFDWRTDFEAEGQKSTKTTVEQHSKPKFRLCANYQSAKRREEKR